MSGSSTGDDCGSSTTTTTLTAETVTGSHELVIQGYSKSKGTLGVGRCVYSSTFAVGGRNWCIAFYPDGERDELADYISVFLHADPDVVGDVKVQYTFSLLDQAGEAVPLYTQTSGMWATFSRTKLELGFDLIKREELELLPYLQDDSFRIKCDVIVFMEIHVEAPQSDLHRRRLDGGGDVTTIATETVTGSHLLSVEGYSNIKGVLGIGRCFYTGIFTVGGHNWCVSYYPDGCDKKSEEYISLFLRVDPSVKGDVKARFKFSLLDQAGEPLLPYMDASKTLIFSSTTQSWGSPKFINRKELELSSYLKDDSFKISCEVVILKESKRTTTVRPSFWGSTRNSMTCRKTAER